MSRRLPLLVGGIAVAAVIVLVVAVAASGGNSGQGNVVVTAPPQSITVPAATTTAARSTVVLGMGHPGDPANTFYELFDRPAGRSTWALATPPGVADNGGLVVGGSPVGALTAGFLPSAAFTFSVLASSPVGAVSWSPGEVPGTLAPWPDALATGTGGQVEAVLTRPTPSVVGTGPGLGPWARTVTSAALSATTSRCAVTAVTAVAVLADGTPVVGTRCAHSTSAGLFTVSAASEGIAVTDGTATPPWSFLGPGLVGRGPSTTTVLRLQATPAGYAALVGSRSGVSDSLVAVWGSNGAASGPGPAASADLAVPSGWSVRATAVGGGSGSGVTVLFGSDTGPGLRVASVSGPDSSWRTSGGAPAGTTAVAMVGDELDAFVPSGSHLGVWASTAGSPWRRTASIDVPIQYGSSG